MRIVNLKEYCKVECQLIMYFYEILLYFLNSTIFKGSTENLRLKKLHMYFDKAFDINENMQKSLRDFIIKSVTEVTVDI